MKAVCCVPWWERQNVSDASERFIGAAMTADAGTGEALVTSYRMYIFRYAVKALSGGILVSAGVSPA